jgi:hypothetical protein
MNLWELRRARRWGSEHIDRYPTREAAEQVARDDIFVNGNKGRIVLVDEDKRIVYYDVHAEES